MVYKYGVIGGFDDYVQYGDLEVGYVDWGLGFIFNIQYVIYGFEERV